MAINILRELGWGEVLITSLAVVKGEPTIFMYASAGLRTQLAFTFMFGGPYFLFLVGDSPDSIDIELEELVLLLKRRNVPFGMFTSYLGEDENLFPIYNWFLKRWRTGGFSAIVAIIQSHKILSLHTFKLKDDSERTVRYLEEQYGERLKSFRETKESSVKLEMVGPSYLVTEEEWVHAWRGLTKR